MLHAAQTGEAAKMSEPIPYHLNADCSVDDIEDSLFGNGTAIIDGLLEPATVERLRAEVERLVYLDHPKHLSEGACQLGRFQIAELETLGASEIMAFAGLDLFEGVCSTFFRPYQADFHKVYCHYDVDEMGFNNEWHYDRGLGLKFFVYLNPVNRENGAFRYDLGSHKSNAVKQALSWQSEFPILNYVPESEVRRITHLEGAAGSVILFDTAGYHRAGTLEHGGERWVVRYHVRSGPRADGEEDVELNPYYRRNMHHYSHCYSVRDADGVSAPGDLGRLLLSGESAEKFRAQHANNPQHGRRVKNDTQTVSTNAVDTQPLPEPVTRKLKRLSAKIAHRLRS